MTSRTLHGPWRHEAIYTRAEIEMLISEERVLPATLAAMLAEWKRLGSDLRAQAQAR